MKILLFTLEYPPFRGGIANYYDNLVKYWPEPADILVLNNNEKKLINNKLPFLKWLPSMWQLWGFIKKNKINYLLVGHILPLGISAYFISKFNKTKYAIFLHGMDFSFATKRRRKKWITKKILKNSDKIICANSYTAELLKIFLGGKTNEKITVINPGIDVYAKAKPEIVTRLKKKYNTENKIVLFSMGRLVKRKGFDKVIEVMPEITKKIPNLCYFIAGSGINEKYLKQKVLNLKSVISNITFLGEINEEEKWAWLKLCDIFIMPARNIKGDFEGFGMVYLEANLAGRPVIAGDSGGVRDAVEDNVNGLLIDPESKKEIKRAVLKLSSDQILKEKLGQQGRQRAINQFSWQKQIKKIYKAIN